MVAPLSMIGRMYCGLNCLWEVEAARPQGDFLLRSVGDPSATMHATTFNLYRMRRVIPAAIRDLEEMYDMPASRGSLSAAEAQINDREERHV